MPRAAANRLAALHRRWHAFAGVYGESTTLTAADGGAGASTTLAAEQYDELDALVAKCAELLGDDDDRDATAVQRANQLLNVARVLDGAGAGGDAGAKTIGCFEWIDGVLIDALESGASLLVDNVNFCNPAVLDRLNPLLEPHGVLLVNERGLVDGEVKVVRPHRDFRLIMAMDPHNGEISRAMRNRGVEIFVPPSQESAVGAVGRVHEHVSVSRLLAACGVRDDGHVRRVWSLHRRLADAGVRVRWRDLTHCAELLVAVAQAGVQPTLDTWRETALVACSGRATTRAAHARLLACVDEWCAASSGDVQQPPSLLFAAPPLVELRRDAPLAAAYTELAAATPLVLHDVTRQVAADASPTPTDGGVFASDAQVQRVLARSTTSTRCAALVHGGGRFGRRTVAERLAEHLVAMVGVRAADNAIDARAR